MPLLLAVLTLFGLLAALLGEGWWWPLSWIALGSPLLTLVWHLWSDAGTPRQAAALQRRRAE
ncbi:MAG: hypothetical protein ACHQIO_11470 [Nevskiales bacterium]